MNYLTNLKIFQVSKNLFVMNFVEINYFECNISTIQLYDFFYLFEY